MKLLLILFLSSIVMISSFVTQPNSKINLLKATNTNRDDVSDRDFKEIFRLSKSVDVTKPASKASPRLPGKRWGEVLGPGIYSLSFLFYMSYKLIYLIIRIFVYPFINR